MAPCLYSECTEKIDQTAWTHRLISGFNGCTCLKYVFLHCDVYMYIWTAPREIRFYSVCTQQRSKLVYPAAQSDQELIEHIRNTWAFADSNQRKVKALVDLANPV